MSIIEDMIRVLENKLSILQNEKATASYQGNLQSVEATDNQIKEVELALEKLR